VRIRDSTYASTWKEKWVIERELTGRENNGSHALSPADPRSVFPQESTLEAADITLLGGTVVKR